MHIGIWYAMHSVKMYKGYNLSNTMLKGLTLVDPYQDELFTKSIEITMQ